MECVKCGEEDLEEAYCQQCVDELGDEREDEGKDLGVSEGEEAGKSEEDERWQKLVDDEARRANIPIYYHHNSEQRLTAMADRILHLERVVGEDA
jgi:hypothetical protein